MAAKKPYGSAPRVRGKVLNQEDYDLLCDLWMAPTVIQAADAAVLANARYFLYRNATLPRTLRVYLQRLGEKLSKQVALDAEQYPIAKVPAQVDLP